MLLLQLHKVSKPLVPPNKMSANPSQMNLTTEVSFDSDLDEEINDLLMLVPQGQQSTDDGGNEDLEDTTESSSSSIVQCDSEPTSALSPLHTQSLLLQVPAGFKQCRVEQIIVQNGGSSLCLLLQWKRDDQKRVSLSSFSCSYIHGLFNRTVHRQLEECCSTVFINLRIQFISVHPFHSYHSRIKLILSTTSQFCLLIISWTQRR